MRKLMVSISFLAFLAFQPVLAQTNTTPDITKPTISGVTVSGVKATTAVISWTTNEAATSYVDFGLTDVYDKTLGEGTYLTAHSVTLLGLSDSTLYHFRIRSKDAAGNEAVSTDTTLTTASSTVNTNATSNTNAVANKNSTFNTNATANKNTNAAKNVNTVKNTNTTKNVNVNKNVNRNTNVNANANTGTDIFNQNVNSEAESVTGTLENTNGDSANVNASATPTSDGRTGIFLIGLGVLLLVGIIAFAWWKARRPPVVRP